MDAPLQMIMLYNFKFLEFSFDPCYVFYVFIINQLIIFVDVPLEVFRLLWFYFGCLSGINNLYLNDTEQFTYWAGSRMRL